MGAYTLLKFTGQLKKEYVELVKERLTTHCFYWPTEIWKAVAKQKPELHKCAHLSNFIPFGMVSAYNFDKCGTGEYTSEVGFSNVVEDETWTFVCDLKNYDGEIKNFLDLAAKTMCEKYVAEVWYEEDAFPEVYTFNVETK